MYIWEYKLIRILKRIKFRSIIYSSFETHKPDKDHWFHIAGKKNDEISKLSLVNLLNHFGQEGWELISLLKEEFPLYYDDGELIEEYPSNSSKEEIYQCILKRKVEEDYEDDDDYER